jgi:pilus assembly protein Flp/PilA
MPLSKIGTGWTGCQSTEAHMRNLVSRFLRDKSGATAIEYGLIAAGIAVVILTAVGTVGTNLKGTFTTVAASI